MFVMSCAGTGFQPDSFSWYIQTGRVHRAGQSKIGKGENRREGWEKNGGLQTSMETRLLLSKLQGHQVTLSLCPPTSFSVFLSTHITQPSKDL